MKRAFTLIEVLVVVAIVALGWLWVPSLFQSSATSTQGQFYQHLQLLQARACMEAQARQAPIALAIRADNRQLAVLVMQGQQINILAQVQIPLEVSFNQNLSSSGGNPGIFTIAGDDDGNLWRLWWWQPSGRPLQTGGVISFSSNGKLYSYSITNEGALIEASL